MNTFSASKTLIQKKAFGGLGVGGMGNHHPDL